MNALPIMSLRDFVAIHDDPRAVVLDARDRFERSTHGLSNPLVGVMYAPSSSLFETLERTATMLCGRHVIVIDSNEEHAIAAARLLRSIDVDAVALQDGFKGWLDAIVESRDEKRDDVEIVTLDRIAWDLHSYVLIESGEAIVVNPSGRPECFLREFERHACQPFAVVDTARAATRGSCGAAIAALTNCAYYVPDRSSAEGESVGFAALDRLDDGTLAVRIDRLGVRLR